MRARPGDPGRAPGQALPALNRSGAAAPAFLVVVGFVAGLALRAWILGSHLGVLESDEASVGLIARHMLRGEFPALIWGQAYGGTHPAFVAAAVFAVFGSGRLQLKLVTVALAFVAATLVARVGRRTVGPDAARVGAVLFWVWPAHFVLLSTKGLPGHYWASLVLGLTAVLLVLRIADEATRTAWWEPPLAGLALGLAFWGGPQIAYWAVPLGLWTLGRMRLGVLRLWSAIPAAVAGALPWLVVNAGTGFASLRAPAAGLPPTTYLFRVQLFFRASLPAALGLQVPYRCDCVLYTSDERSLWLPSRPAGLGHVLYLVALAALAYLLVRRPRGTGLLLLVVALYPAIFAISAYSWYADAPMYLLFLAPALSLLAARGLVLVGRAATVAAIALAITATAAALTVQLEAGVPAFSAGEANVPDDMRPLLRTLDAQQVKTAFAMYWVAYRITFESEERVVATPIEAIRYRPHDELVRASSYPAYVIVAGSPQDRRLARALEQLGVAYTRTVSAGFVVFVPERTVHPQDLHAALF